jgi:hypothetical protein
MGDSTRLLIGNLFVIASYIDDMLGRCFFDNAALGCVVGKERQGCALRVRQCLGDIKRRVFDRAFWTLYLVANIVVTVGSASCFDDRMRMVCAVFVITNATLIQQVSLRIVLIITKK